MDVDECENGQNGGCDDVCVNSPGISIIVILHFWLNLIEYILWITQDKFSTKVDFDLN